MLKRRFPLILLLHCVLFLSSQQLIWASSLPPKALKRPYSFKKVLVRAEELFQQGRFKDALIFYYESLALIRNVEMRSKIHFRMGECLEGVRRFDFANYHYKRALRGTLPEVLSERVMIKLEHLPKLAQHEEAMRLYGKAMAAFRTRNIRAAIDDYLESLQLEPALMAKNDSGLINDAVNYLTYLSESKENEPGRLLKLASFLELRGDTDKAVETLKQILIIYPDADEAQIAEQKVAFFSTNRNTYLEPQKPEDALAQVVPQENDVVVETTVEFQDPGTVSKELTDCAYTFRARNEQNNVPRHRFELFSFILGNGSEQKEFVYTASEGITDKSVQFETESLLYQVDFKGVQVTTAYIQDIYGEGMRAAPLFSSVRVHLLITRK